MDSNLQATLVTAHVGGGVEPERAQGPGRYALGLGPGPGPWVLGQGPWSWVRALGPGSGPWVLAGRALGPLGL